MIEIKGPNAPIVPQSARGSEAASSLNVPLLIAAGVVIPTALAYGFVIGNELQVIAVILAVFGALLIARIPFIGLLFFITLLYTRPEEALPALTGMHFTLLVSVVALVGMILQMLMDKQRIVRTPMNGMILAFGAAVALSLNGSDDQTAALMDIAKLVLIVFLVLNLVRSPKRYEVLVTVLVLATSYLAAYSIYRFHTGAFMVDGGQERAEATGLFSDPNDLATAFVAAVALVIMRVVQTRGLTRAAYIGLLGTLLYATAITHSRGGLIALAATVAGYVIMVKVAWPRKIAMALLGLVLLAGISGGRMRNFDSDEESAHTRVLFWDNALEQLTNHPLTGVGYLKFPENNDGMTAHNSFVLCFAELGLVGYFFWMGCLYICLRKVPRTEIGPEPPMAEGQNLVAARISVCAYLVASFFLSHTYSPVLFLLMCLPLACQSRALALHTGKADSAFHWKTMLAVAGLCTLSIVLIRQMVDHLLF